MNPKALEVLAQEAVKTIKTERDEHLGYKNISRMTRLIAAMDDLVKP